MSIKVVYDRINYQRVNWRQLPALDVMFALGNDAAAQLLVPELDQYHYADNLAALRYLIDSYEPEYWKGTFFNGWLNAIRALNLPTERSVLPQFMHTAAWWQEKMNTQLASWAVRMTICSMPSSHTPPREPVHIPAGMLSLFRRSMRGSTRS